MNQNPVCPAASPPFGVNAGSWPVFQGNVQHTGVSPYAGPTCSKQIWRNKPTNGQLHAAPVLAPGRTGESETLFVPVGKEPLCALNIGTGATYWCNTDMPGKLADRSTAVIGNGGYAYVGTRDNDLWAINNPPQGSSSATVAWQQFVCTDGDITAPPIIGNDGLVYMASDSLGSGTLMAMCPGPTRQPKWCMHPVGGGIRNASPALSPAGDELYVLFGGGGLLALDPQTGAEHWRVQVEPKQSVARIPNRAPVVNPDTGRIYLGLMQALWAVDPPTTPGGAATVTKLFDVAAITGRVDVPPAVDVAHGTIVLAVAQRGRNNTIFGLDMNGGVKWQRNGLGIGKFKTNNPPVVDVNGNVYFTFGKSLIALHPDGSQMWRLEFKKLFGSSPILAAGRLYVGTGDGAMYAIGDCP